MLIEKKVRPKILKWAQVPRISRVFPGRVPAQPLAVWRLNFTGNVTNLGHAIRGELQGSHINIFVCVKSHSCGQCGVAQGKVRSARPSKKQRAAYLETKGNSRKLLANQSINHIRLGHFKPTSDLGRRVFWRASMDMGIIPD